MPIPDFVSEGFLRRERFGRIQSFIREKTESAVQLFRRKNNFGSDDKTIQSEIELVVRKVLDLYVKSWAEEVSLSQILDKEVQNDVRRLITEVSERIRKIDRAKFCLEMLEVVGNHAHKRSLSREGDVLASAEDISGPDLESYVSVAVEKLLMSYGVDKVISTGVVFDGLGNIISEQASTKMEPFKPHLNKKIFLKFQLFLRPIRHLAEPKHMTNFILLKDWKGDKIMRKAEIEASQHERPKLKCSSSETVSSRKKSLPSDDSNIKYGRAVSENSTTAAVSTSKRPTMTSSSRKKTLDLTGYSSSITTNNKGEIPENEAGNSGGSSQQAANNSGGQQTQSRDLHASGKISTALGTYTRLHAGVCKHVSN